MVVLSISLVVVFYIKVCTSPSVNVRDRANHPNGDLLKPLLLPRVPGTSAHLRVQSFLADHMRSLGWNVELDPFEYNKIPMANVIATLSSNTFLGNDLVSKSTDFSQVIVNENGTHRSEGSYDEASNQNIVLAAHYDSKKTVFHHSVLGEEISDDGFVGATDAAWSCALLLLLAEISIGPALKKTARNVTVTIIFFDGEESNGGETGNPASWCMSDGILGAKHLASRWKDELSNISLFILLDLLGAANPRIPSFFPETHLYYQMLAQIESELYPLDGVPKIFSSQFQGRTGNGSQMRHYTIIDDHVPFAIHGVPILHLIPIPFPTVWHTLADDATALDYKTCQRLCSIFENFLNLILL